MPHSHVYEIVKMKEKLEGVSLKLKGIRTSESSDTNGFFEFSGLNKDTYVLRDADTECAIQKT